MKLPKWTKNVLFIIAAILAIYFLESWGVIGIIIFIIIIAIQRIYVKRDMLGVSMGNIEAMIWGKPLRKELWDKGEMKNTKVKFVWGKEKFKWNKYYFYALAWAMITILIITLWRMYR